MTSFFPFKVAKQILKYLNARRRFVWGLISMEWALAKRQVWTEFRSKHLVSTEFKKFSSLGRAWVDH